MTSKWLAIATIGIVTSVALIAQEPPPAQGRGPEQGGRGGRGGRGRGPLGGAAAGMVQDPQKDTTPPVLPADLKPGGVLIFSKTSGFREEASIEASDAALSVIAKERGWPYFVTENGAVINRDQLGKFKLMIFNNTSGDILNDEQREAFKTWMENGGSFLGIHGAGGDPVNFQPPRTAAVWKWYIDTLLGAQFIGHSSIMPGDIHIEDAKSPVTKGLPAIWHRNEEWYAFAENPRKTPGVHILATVDEKTYTPGRATMGDDHPLIWWHCVEKGHAIFSALGHAGMMYTEPLVIQLLDNAMSWGLSKSGHSCAAEK